MLLFPIQRSGILHGVGENTLLGVKKEKISLQSPNLEFEAQYHNILYGRVTYPSIRKFTWSKKKYTFGGQKGKKSLQSPKEQLPYAQLKKIGARGKIEPFTKCVRIKNKLRFLFLMGKCLQIIRLSVCYE
jgi:hypothetical protein